MPMVYAFRSQTFDPFIPRVIIYDYYYTLGLILRTKANNVPEPISLIGIVMLHVKHYESYKYVNTIAVYFFMCSS